MNILKLTAALLLALLAGCATCRDHPVACAVVGAVIVTSVALSVAHHNNSSDPMARAQHMSPCAPQGLTQCQP